MPSREESSFTRDRNIFGLEDQTFDLIVIGGGIVGAGIARDAVMRGLSVALVEAKDFGSGTSSKSSKMLHGGLRYLENLELGLVYEASRERRLHSEFLAKHMVKAQPFMVPVYNWSPHALPTVWAGVFMYDALALFRNHGTRYMGRDAVCRDEPSLASDGLKGGVVFHDVVMDDARLNLENVRSAVSKGAVAANYLAVRGFEKDSNGKIIGVWARDISPLAKRLASKNLGSGKDVLVKAKIVVNATGPWSDYIRRLDKPNSASVLRPTKGAHLILDKSAFGKDHAFVLSAKKDDRTFFAVPWYDKILVGTTDTDYDARKDGPLGDITANPNDIDYLLEGVKRTFPGAKVTDKDIHSSFAGIRPLVGQDVNAPESSVSREHKILVEDSGLISIVGGKYTTYRPMAREVVDLVIKNLQKDFSDFRHRSLEVCRTDLEPIVHSSASGRFDFELEGEMGVLEEYGGVLGPEVVAHLRARYGFRWRDVAQIAISQRELAASIIPGEKDILAEAVYAKKHEMVVSLEDFFRRRTMVALRSPLDNHYGAVEKVHSLLFGEDKADLPSPEQVRKWQGREFLK